MTNGEAKIKIRKILMAEIDKLPSHYDADIGEQIFDNTAEFNELLELNKIVSEAFEALERDRPKGYWYVDGETEHCSVCKLPWNYYMTMNGDDIGYFDPMPNFCLNCGADMRSDDDE